MKALKKVRNGKIKKKHINSENCPFRNICRKDYISRYFAFKKQKECLIDKIEMSENGQL